MVSQFMPSCPGPLAEQCPVTCGTCPETTSSDTTEMPSVCGATESATYDVEFTAIWTQSTSPKFWVENAHFSRIVGWSSAEVINMEGQLASSLPGIQAQAETGSPNEWASTLASRFGFVAVGNRGTGTVDGYELSDTVQLTIDPSQPYASFTAMVAPSPDWFVYGNGAPLCNENGWVESLEIEASYILDAGTDAGTDFTSDNEAEDPPVVITSLGEQGPMMSIRFTKSSGTTEQPTVTFDCVDNEDGLKAAFGVERMTCDRLWQYRTAFGFNDCTTAIAAIQGEYFSTYCCAYCCNEGHS